MKKLLKYHIVKLIMDLYVVIRAHSAEPSLDLAPNFILGPRLDVVAIFEGNSAGNKYRILEQGTYKNNFISEEQTNLLKEIRDQIPHSELDGLCTGSTGIFRHTAVG